VATPSSAARGVLPHRTDLLRAIDTANGALVRCATRAVERHRRDLSRIEVRSPLASPERLLQARRVRVDAGSAELEAAVTTRWRGWQQQVAALRVRLERCNPSVRLGARRERLTLVTYKLERAAREALARRIRRCDAVAQRLPAVAAAALADRRTQLELVSAKLEGRDPTRILARGYAIVTVDGVAVRDASTIEPGTRIAAQLARGRLVARVEPAGNDGGK
jgi:exodeoxyribonuclease VII large subunit